MADAQIVLRAVDQTRAAFQSVGQQLDRLKSSALSVQGVFASLAGVGIGAGFVGLVRNSINAADALNDLSERTGVTVERLSALQYAAKFADLSNEGLANGLRALSRSIDANAEGFARLGVATRDNAGNLRATDVVLLDVADRFAKLQDGAGKAAVAQELFGKAGTDLIPLLNQGRSGIQGFADEAQRLGLVVSTQTARAAAEFNDNLDRLRANVTGLGQSIAANLVGPLARATTALLDASRAAGTFGEGLARSLVGQGRDLPNELQQVEARIAGVRRQIAQLKGTIGDSALARSIPGLSRVADLEKQERELRVQRDFLKGLQQIREERSQAEQQAAAPKGQIAAPADKEALSAAKRAAQERDKAILEATRETGRQVAAQAEDRAKVAEAYLKVELDALKKVEDEKQAKIRETASQVEALLGRTSLGQVQQLEAQLAALAEAGAKAPQAMQAQYEQAFEILNAELQKAKGVSADTFQAVAQDSTKAFKDLEFAVQGWGRQFTDTLADVVLTGKLNFSELANSIVRDLLRMQIQASITKPLFEAFGAGFGSLFSKSALGNVFGPGGLQKFATGGVVNGPTLFPFANGIGLMGEAGPEAILPLRRGAGGRLGVEASGGGATVINVNVDSRADRALVSAEVRRAVEEGLARDRDQQRRGRA